MFELQYSTEYTYMHHVLKFNVLFKSEENKSSNKSSSTRVGARGDCSGGRYTQMNSPDEAPDLPILVGNDPSFCGLLLVRQFRVYGTSIQSLL